jgi:hypothetical protein
MTRRQILGAAAVLPAACGEPFDWTQDRRSRTAAAAVPAAPFTDPTVDDLINLAERGSDPQYYGQVLAECLAETGTVARDNGDGTISVYSPDAGRSWRKKTALNSVRPVPAGLLQRFKPAQRADGFPTGVPFRPLS